MAHARSTSKAEPDTPSAPGLTQLDFEGPLPPQLFKAVKANDPVDLPAELKARRGIASPRILKPAERLLIQSSSPLTFRLEAKIVNPLVFKANGNLPETQPSLLYEP